MIPRTKPVYLSLERSDDEVGVLLRDLELHESDGPEGEKRLASERIRRITVDLPLDAQAQMYVEVIGSNDEPVIVKANIYDLRAAGYPLLPGGAHHEGAAEEILAMLRGETPGIRPKVRRRSRLVARLGPIALCWHRQGWLGWPTVRRPRHTGIVL